MRESNTSPGRVILRDLGATAVLKNKFALIPLLFVFQLACADELLDQAEALIAKGQAEQAYQLLKPQADARAGEANFDYVYASAALDAGQAMDAVFALERVIDANPDHGPARAKLALAYLALGETDNAESEFGKVKDMDLPEDVAKTIDKYLSQIERYETLTRPQWRRYVKTGFGYDSNVNAATDDGQVAVPALGGGSMPTTADDNFIDWWVMSLADPSQVEISLSFASPVPTGLFTIFVFDAAQQVLATDQIWSPRFPAATPSTLGCSTVTSMSRYPSCMVHTARTAPSRGCSRCSVCRTWAAMPPPQACA